MTRKQIAALVFQCLQSPPRRDAVLQFASLRSADLRKLLLHLDQTGLAIYLLNHLLEHDLFSLLAPQLQGALTHRFERNQSRAEDMFDEFGRVVRALESAHVRYAVMKGFSLVPDYTPAVCLRHQTDLDLLIDVQSTGVVRETLEALGYNLESEDPTGETKFVRQFGRPFPGMADIYAPQNASRVELHHHFWERRFQVLLDLDHAPLAQRTTTSLRGVTFCVLAEEDIFIGQLLHAFRHFLKGWIRSSWLFEIASFVRARFGDHRLWTKISSHVYPEKTNHACGLMLLLCRQLLTMEIPPALHETFIAKLPRHLRLWVELVGARWACSDMEGSKLSLLIHEHFVSDPHSWRKQHATLLIPRSTPSVGLQTRSTGEATAHWRRRQASVIFQRAAFHFSRNLEYAVHSLRWRYALHTTERLKPRFASY